MIDLNKYKNFVWATTSPQSKIHAEFLKSLEHLRSQNVEPSLLLTAAIGLSSETGEFDELVKKTTFQGKPLDVHHMKRELGDIFWYWINACNALQLDPYDVIEENVTKLKARYPNGEFDVWFSENRKEGDL